MNYKMLVSAILSAVFLFSASLYSAEPLVKFYLNDGSTKQYNLSEIDSLGVIDKKNNYVMRIHYDDTLIAYYPTEIIGSIKFENDTLNIYIFSYPKPYKISSIDSLIFYIDQWQPLTIGSQVWMLKNLNVDHYRNGDSILEVSNSTEWSHLTSGAWCHYNNEPTNGKLYGKLYTWDGVNDPRGLAPLGWHVPTDDEWTTLTNYSGGESTCGKILKENGRSHWLKDNIATNENGFTALPGGMRDGSGILFYLINEGGTWWASTQADDARAWFRSLEHDRLDIRRDKLYRNDGMSVRCVKDK